MVGVAIKYIVIKIVSALCASARQLDFVALLDVAEDLEHDRSLFKVVIKVKSFKRVFGSLAQL